MRLGERWGVATPSRHYTLTECERLMDCWPVRTGYFLGHGLALVSVILVVHIALEKTFFYDVYSCLVSDHLRDL